MAALGRVSRAPHGLSAARNCARDEGGPFEFGDQEPISSHRKLLRAKAVVVSVAETPGYDDERGRTDEFPCYFPDKQGIQSGRTNRARPSQPIAKPALR